MKPAFQKNGGASRQRKGTALTFILIVVVLVVLVFSTGWFMSSSQRATETSVYNVSEF